MTSSTATMLRNSFAPAAAPRLTRLVKPAKHGNLAESHAANTVKPYLGKNLRKQNQLQQDTNLRGFIHGNQASWQPTLTH